MPKKRLTYHQEGKVEGLEKYQVRNDKAIQTYIALVVVAFSMLKCTVHDDDLLSTLNSEYKRYNLPLGFL